MHGSARGLTHLTHSLISDHSHPSLYCPLLLGVFGLVCECITNPYRIPCSLCERAWCFRFGPHAAYQSLPASTCKGHWFLVWSWRPLPRLTIRYHASVLSLRRSATFTIHHLLRPDTQTDTHIEHTRIEHSRTWAHLIKVSTVVQRWHSTAQ